MTSRRATIFLSAALFVACEKSNVPASREPASPALASSPSSSPAPSIPARPESVAAAPWNDELGAFVATPSLDTGAPVVFTRDTTVTRQADVELFSHDASASKATLRVGDALAGCALRRTATIVTSDGHAPASTWSLALAAGSAAPIAVDGISESSARDSASLVAGISRLVSALPEDSASGPYHGLPVVVRDAWRFHLPDSTRGVIAIAMRSLNTESNPRTQIVALIAEPDSGSNTLRTAYFEREAGPEDRVEGADLLAVFRTRAGHVDAAFVREGDRGMQVEIVERVARGAWKLGWTSATLPCSQREPSR
jgi:hypothetical protein